MLVSSAMRSFPVLLAAASVALAQTTVPIVSTYSADNCAGTALATWSGVVNEGFCQATPGAISLNITAGTEKNCEIDLFTTSDCDGTTGGFIASPPNVDSCYTASEEFASVRILCILTG